jgi:Mrp family chromosome partitioning ATPase
MRPDPSRAEGALGPYLRAIRAHKLLVLFTIAAVTALGAAYALTRTRDYTATAHLLVTPISQDDQNFIGLPVIRDSGDPTRTVQTAASVIDSQEAAALTAKRLRGDWTARKVRKQTSVLPQGQSNVVDVTGTTTSAPAAARLANAFAKATTDLRSAALRAQARTALGKAQAQLRGLTGDPQGALAQQLSAQVSALQQVVTGTDPTLQFSEPAVRPTDASGVPLGRRARRDGPVSSPPFVREVFRTLHVQLELTPGRHRAIAMTSASGGDGKTTSAINFALALAGAGRQVILMDFDLRKPDLTAQLKLTPRYTIFDLMGQDVPLEAALEPLPGGPGVSVLCAGEDLHIADLDRLTRRMPGLIEEALELADYVVIDTPPLGEVSDALKVATSVDDLLVVSNLGHTNARSFETMRDLLERVKRPPSGYVLINATQVAPSTYYHYGYGQNGGDAPPAPAREEAPS